VDYFEAIINLIKVLIWPAVMFVAIFEFRGGINNILLRFAERLEYLREAKFPGGRVTFHERVRLRDLPAREIESDRRQ
jgi:hypothetical protein